MMKSNYIKLQTVIKNRLFKNMSWLFILNFSNTIIPYFTFPYITRIFLPEGYGEIAFALALVAYFITFIDYGFDLTGARKIAIEESNKGEISKVYSSIIVTKLIFFLLSVLLIISLTLNIKTLYESRDLIFIFLIMAFSHVVMPTWLFQGLQKVKYMTVVSLVVRIMFLISVFSLIKSREDIYLYAVVHSLSFVVIGVTSMIIVRFHLKIKFCKVTFVDIKALIKEGFFVFTSSAIIKVMGTTGIFVLGLFHLPVYVGYYASLNKVNQVIIVMFIPIGQALFPHHSKMFAESFDKGYSSAQKISKVLIPLFTIMAIIIIIFRKTIVLLILGPDYVSAANLLIILAFLPLLSIISNFMGTQILVASSHLKEYSRAFIRGGLIQIFLYFMLGYFYGMWGVAFAALLGALFNLLFLYIEIIKVVEINKQERINNIC